MKNKRKASKLFLYLGMLSVALTVFLCPANSLTVQAAAPGAETAEPCSDIIGYRYFTSGNKVYKQLYNYTKKVWIGEPIYVCDVP